MPQRHSIEIQPIHQTCLRTIFGGIMSTRAASAGAYTALGGVERAHGIPQRGSGEVTFRHTLASVGYTVRVLFMVLPVCDDILRASGEWRFD